MRNRSEPPADPEDAQGFNDRGNRYSRNGVYDQAISDYTRAIELDARFAEAVSYTHLTLPTSDLV